MVCLAQAQEAPKPPVPLGPGDHTRTLMMGDQKRTFVVHVPPHHDSGKPSPIVLALHGAAMDAAMMAGFSGLNRKSDEAGFIVVYPNGLGVGPFRKWNAGGFSGKLAEGKADDVAFIDKLLDDIASLVKVDEQRVYACGMSNGGMMCYRLASELSDRIASIAPVAGTIVIEESRPKRPVPVIHFHGSKDNIVPFEIPKGTSPSFIKLQSVEDSIQTWVKLNDCDETPTTDTISKDGDEMKVTRKSYRGGKEGSEVVLIVIEEGGHTWPGQTPSVGFIGKSVKTVSANDLIWEFFQKHPLKQ
ncbi:MAG: polyhydroxybutyrate depolymerase [Planctomyces sp.]|nr:polyhydroxybutyrate depolymerase [Planctomyces sp.]